MAEQSGFAITDALKWLGSFVLGAGGLKFYFRARNAGYLDRIIKLERAGRENSRVMQETVDQLQELASTVDIESGNTHRRFMRIENDNREFRRDVSQDLRRIADRLDAQLHRSAAAAPGETEPPRQSPGRD